MHFSAEIERAPRDSSRSPSATRAVGTAAAVGVIIAIPGAIGYTVAGWKIDGLPAGSLGYANLLALGALIPLTMGVAPLGAKAAHAIPKSLLSYAFSAFLAVTSIRMFIDLWQHLSSSRCAGRT
ncbi:MAG: sulfite exporter TauE/SafE family protein [Alphaproteobacteria bacterium]|nr:sulfite exporter TauE/SafE family protein [Alphaproteobacteria bacterium]MBU1552237.1 sulfite exporter TauE/SafE family protein [Alphaproteobacteria bacterium]MBU2336855.1 sulfite exporter TauE/SafE family protein [Alphaproteobacteria bacterium]MBU2389611.1 sulfite exporter TauE/SafE family protein [Alphaproteobacteria bacterium]